MAKINDKIQVVLNEQTYYARLDFRCIAETQWALEQERNKFMTVPQMFKAVSDDNLTVIGEILIQAILRCHPQLTHETIYENMKFQELSVIREAIGNLIQASLPQDDDKKKDE